MKTKLDSKILIRNSNQTLESPKSIHFYLDCVYVYAYIFLAALFDT